MATFYHPPPAFVGGSQPLANHVGHIPSESVAPQSAFGHLWRDIAVQVALSAWVPPDPVPILARNASPALAVVPVNNPPFTQNDPNSAIIIGAWAPGPPLPILPRNVQLITGPAPPPPPSPPPPPAVVASVPGPSDSPADIAWQKWINRKPRRKPVEVVLPAPAVDLRPSLDEMRALALRTLAVMVEHNRSRSIDEAMFAVPPHDEDDDNEALALLLDD